MFGSLPKLADRNFVIGFLLPVLLAAVALAFLYRDTYLVASIWNALKTTKTLEALSIFVICVWTAAVVLTICNHTLYQMMEGYIGPFNNRWWKLKRIEEFAKTQKALEATFDKLILTKDDCPAKWRAYKTRLSELQLAYPPAEHLVLATRFGNAIRAFESYPDTVYGFDAIAGWSRLGGVLPKEFATQLADAKAIVDFLVNLWFLALAVAVVASVETGIAATAFISVFHATTAWSFEPLLAVACAIGVCTAAYHLAIGQARVWGEVVKSAFDLYLPALASQLGFELPRTAEARRNFWIALSDQILYQAPMKPE